MGMNEIEHYTLTCEKCGEAYYSKEGFPHPQICPECLMREKLAETLYGELTYKNYLANPEVRRHADLKIGEILSLETKTHRIAVIKKGEPLLLNEEEISKLFPDAIRFMASLKIVAQAQYDNMRKGV